MQITRKRLVPGKSNKQAVLEVLESGDKFTAEEVCNRLKDPERPYHPDRPNPVLKPKAVIKAIADLINKDGVTIEKTPAAGKQRYYRYIQTVEQVKRTKTMHSSEMVVSSAMVDACFHLVQSKPGAQITPDMIADWYELSAEEATVLFNKVSKIYENQLRIHRSIALR